MYVYVRTNDEQLASARYIYYAKDFAVSCLLFIIFAWSFAKM